MKTIEELLNKIGICEDREFFYSCKTAAGAWRKASKRQRVQLVDELFGYNFIDNIAKVHNLNTPDFEEAIPLQEKYIGWLKVRTELKERFQLSEEFLGEGAR